MMVVSIILLFTSFHTAFRSYKMVLCYKYKGAYLKQKIYTCTYMYVTSFIVMIVS